MTNDDTSYKPRSPDLSMFSDEPGPPPPLNTNYPYNSCAYPTTKTEHYTLDSAYPWSPSTPQSATRTTHSKGYIPPHTPSSPHSLQTPSHSFSPYPIPAASQTHNWLSQPTHIPPLAQIPAPITSKYFDPPAANPAQNPSVAATAAAPAPAQVPTQAQAQAPASATMPPRKAAAQVKQEEFVDTSPVKTKFPTARIKRIMQADSEVGKVAQQAPIAMGKALEMFMVQIISKSADVAREKNSKRITAHTLKHLIDCTTEWDFLRDIVANASEEKEKDSSKGKAKAETESEEEVEVKKKGRGGGRKKKAPAAT